MTSSICVYNGSVECLFAQKVRQGHIRVWHWPFLRTDLRKSNSCPTYLTVQCQADEYPSLP